MLSLLRPMLVAGTDEPIYGREVIYGNDVDVLAGNIRIMAYATALNLFPRLAHETTDYTHSSGRRAMGQADCGTGLSNRARRMISPSHASGLVMVCGLPIES